MLNVLCNPSYLKDMTCVFSWDSYFYTEDLVALKVKSSILGWCTYVVFLGKILYSCVASFYPVVMTKINAGG